MLNIYLKNNYMGVISHILAGQHIRKHLQKKLSSKIGVRSFMSYKAHSKLLKLSFSPILIIVVQLWTNIKNKGNIDKLYRLQKRAARNILNEKDRCTPTSVLFRELRCHCQTILLLEN